MGLWKAECIERCPLGLAKGRWKRADDQSTGTESVVSFAPASPFRDEVTRQLPISYRESCQLSLGGTVVKWLVYV